MGSPDGSYLWESYRNKSLRQWGWTQLETEPGCFLYRDSSTSHVARLLADTDDFLITAQDTELLERLISQLQKEWDVKEQKPVSQHMGVAILREQNSTRLSVSKHIDQLASDMSMSDCNPAKLPHDTKVDLCPRKPGEQILDDATKLLYAHAVGLTRFITDTVFYEVAYIASQLASAISAPTHRHYAALKGLVRYLRGRRTSSICYKFGLPSSITAFSDSDWAGCSSTRRSRTGIAMLYAGDLVHWSSKLQPTVTLSTAEAEYNAAAEAARVLTWIRSLAHEWEIPLDAPPTLFIDNAAAVAMAHANGPTMRSKHIDTKSHYIAQQVRDKKLRVRHIPGTEQLADLFTKPLPASTFNKLIELIRTHANAAEQGCQQHYLPSSRIRNVNNTISTESAAHDVAAPVEVPSDGYPVQPTVAVSIEHQARRTRLTSP